MTTCLTHISSHPAQLQPVPGLSLQKPGLAQHHLHKRQQAHESRAASQARSAASSSPRQGVHKHLEPSSALAAQLQRYPFSTAF